MSADRTNSTAEVVPLNRAKATKPNRKASPAQGFDLSPLVDARALIDRLQQQYRDNPGADALLGIASTAIRDAGILLIVQAGGSQ